jgi:hypothetical protein
MKVWKFTAVPGSAPSWFTWRWREERDGKC